MMLNIFVVLMIFSLTKLSKHSLLQLMFVMSLFHSCENVVCDLLSFSSYKLLLVVD